MGFRLRATGRDAVAVDAAEVRRALAVLADPESGIQIQVAPSWRHQTFAGRDLDAATNWAAKHGADATAVYYALNPVPPNLTGKARVGDVLRRRWLLVDIDRAKTDANRDLSATEEEKAAGIKLAADVRAGLLGRGWPDPVIIDSGNGQHLLYRLDLPADDEHRDLCKATLRALATEFDGPRGAIGSECYDARRVAKLPGTWARKGPESEDRPWRISRLIFAPPAPKPVSAELLRRVAGDVKPTEAPGAKRKTPNASPFVLRALSDGESAYVTAAIKKECDYVRSGRHKNLEGRNNALNAAAFALGQLVAGGVLDRAEAEGELTAAAVDSGLDRDPGCGERGIAASIRSGIEAGLKEPRGVPEKPAAAEPAPAQSNGKHDGPKAAAAWGIYFGGDAVVEGTNADLEALAARKYKAAYQRYDVYTLGELLALEIPDPNWAIPGILAEGLNMLAGSPKMGKSMLALNLALTVAGGGKALGNVQTVPGDVLYLSLEDQVRRVQSRARRMTKALGTAAAHRLRVVTKWPRMDRGGVELLRQWTDRAESPRLLVVDVLGKFRPLLRDKGSQYEQDSQHLYAIKEFADEQGFTALILHHTRKSAGGKKDTDADEFEDISGTQGLGGACDGIVMLKRSRRSNDAVISVTGRDEAERRLALQFDPDTFTWTSLGDAEELLTGKFQKAVVDLFKRKPGALMFVSQVALQLKADDSAVRTTLYRLEEKGIVRSQGSGWIYPGEEHAKPSTDSEEF